MARPQFGDFPEGMPCLRTPEGKYCYSWWKYPLLVGGLKHFLFFHIGNNNPMWLIFFRGVGQPPTRRWWWKYVVALSENGVPHSIHWLIISFPIQPAGKPFQTTRIKSWMSKLGTAGAIPCPSFSPWSSLARWASHGYAWDLLEGES